MIPVVFGAARLVLTMLLGFVRTGWPLLPSVTQGERQIGVTGRGVDRSALSSCVSFVHTCAYLVPNSTADVLAKVSSLGTPSPRSSALAVY